MTLTRIIGGVIATALGTLIAAAVVIFAGYQWLCGSGQPFCH